jgi:hypothetical protein
MHKEERRLSDTRVTAQLSLTVDTVVDGVIRRF